MPRDTRDRIRRHLHALAGRVAAATDADDLVTAVGIVRQVETVLGRCADEDTDSVSAPLVSRRFSEAHRQALAEAARCPERLAALLLADMHAPPAGPPPATARTPSGVGPTGRKEDGGHHDAAL